MQRDREREREGVHIGHEVEQEEDLLYCLFLLFFHSLFSYSLCFILFAFSFWVVSWRSITESNVFRAHSFRSLSISYQPIWFSVCSLIVTSTRSVGESFPILFCCLPFSSSTYSSSFVAYSCVAMLKLFFPISLYIFQPFNSFTLPYPYPFSFCSLFKKIKHLERKNRRFVRFGKWWEKEYEVWSLIFLYCVCICAALSAAHV